MKGNGKKKILIGVVTILFSLVLFSFIMISNAEEVTVVGTWDVSADDGASNVTATLYSDGNFVISGTGEMKDYSLDRYRPYYDYREDIKTVEIQSGVTSIGRQTFCWCTSLSSIEIPESVTSIEYNAFYGAELTMEVAKEAENIQEIELPEIIKRAMKEGDILYIANDFTLKNCSLNEDKTKLVIDTEVASEIPVSLEVTEGALYGLTVLVVPSGTITYSRTSWTKDNLTAIIHVANDETI